MSETNSTDEQTVVSGEMSLVDHLQELRKRIIICLVAVGVTSTGCYFYAAQLVHVITAPAGKLYFMNPAEAFFAYLKISLFAGLLLALPLVLYQVWAFIIPALTTRERTAAVILVPASVFLFFSWPDFFLLSCAASRAAVFYEFCDRYTTADDFIRAVLIICNIVFAAVWLCL